jgi:hypothetical protein
MTMNGEKDARTISALAKTLDTLSQLADKARQELARRRGANRTHRIWRDCVRSLREKLIALPKAEPHGLSGTSLTRREVLTFIRNGWLFWARDDQWPPDGHWQTWLDDGRAGRGQNARWRRMGAGRGGRPLIPALKRIALIGQTSSRCA